MKNKNLIKTICTVIILIFSVLIIYYPSGNVKVSADSVSEEKIYCNATLQDDFAEDRVILKLSKTASLNPKTYGVEDFSEILCESVTDLSSEATAVALGYKTNDLVNIEKYHRLLLVILTVKSKQYVLDSINLLMERSDIIYASPDFIISGNVMNATPSDTYASLQYALSKIEAQKAWDYATGSSAVKVGVLDSGIYANHPDLANVVINDLCRDFSGGVEENVDIPVDIYGHGTGVAGVIGAIGNNDIGITGVCWNVKLVSLKVFAPGYHYIKTALILAVNYAEANGISVLNFSGATGGYDELEKSTIETYSGLFICSAGNSNQNIDIEATATYPASYNLPNMIAVGAVDEEDQRAMWANSLDEDNGSNYGANTVGIYAPGDNIFTLGFENDYTDWEGTSFSAPYVTGVAALLLSYNPNLTTAQLKSAILNGSDSITISVSNGSSQSVKRLNAFKAIKYAIENFTNETSVTACKTIESNVISGNASYFYQRYQLKKITVSKRYQYTFTVSGTTEIKQPVLLDFSFAKKNISVTSSADKKKYEFSVYLSVGTYFIRTDLANSDASGQIDLQISGPYHDCSSWTYSSTSEHSGTCKICAKFLTESHYISHADANDGDNYAMCLGCNRRLDLRKDFARVEPGSTNLKITLNGSYILPSGIVVLVPEDIDAYLSHTLIFYDHGQLPEVA